MILAKKSFLSLKLGVTLLLLISFSSYGETKPKYVPTTVPLSQDHAYFNSGKQTDFWKLIPFYVPQHNSKACSVASVVTVLNALWPDKRQTSDAENISVESLFKLSPAFKKAVGPTGKGQTLNELKKNLSFLEAMSESQYSLEVIRFDGKDSKAEHEKLRKLLIENEKNQNNFIIANFLQSELTGDPEGVGHISPIGAYDADKDRVLILDTDRAYYEPYWVKSETLMKGLNAIDSSSKLARGILMVSRKR